MISDLLSLGLGRCVVNRVRGWSDIEPSDEVRHGAAPGMDIGTERRAGEVEAEQDAQERLPRTQTREPDQEPDQDAEQKHEGNGQDQEALLSSRKCAGSGVGALSVGACVPGAGWSRCNLRRRRGGMTTGAFRADGEYLR
jgi:hypothetical protein